ncbi:MAG: hypothetical protein COV66_08400 [Nitrospinae bacterium CG11_big_fil_rev_8_21_14_0_20_45_15]|nr:MAG: hypothetical protein COV66_08400 [Nitrospinae bacterium CG11_big_fil_rev_8_21_14_0_20_45_15]
MKVIAFPVTWVGKNLETLFAICKPRLRRGSLQKLFLQYLVRTFKPAGAFLGKFRFPVSTNKISFV